MHAVIRRYSGPGASQLFSELERRSKDVEEIIRGVSGFRSYSLIRTDDGGISVTVCRDRAGTEESTQRAAGWIRENFPNTASPPDVTEGEVILQLSP